ncbi:MAG: cytochrome b/b6 domain-containing protein [Allosphingosinicella sp.]
MQGLPHGLQGAGPLSDSGGRPRVRIWDAPTRIVHWAMAALIPFSWWTATHDQLERHRASGYALLGLLLFRLIWGVAGSETARFARFVKGPRAILAYLRGAGPAAAGHNPLGALSIVAMLAALALQIGLGLFAVDEDGIESGPLSWRVDFDTARWAAGLHHKMFWLVAGLAALHVAAILFYAIRRRRNLVTPMVTGRAQAEGEAPAMAPWWRAVIVAAVAAGLAWFVASGARV